MEIKVRGKTLVITYKDVFMDNGSSVQLITQTKSENFYQTCYVISKKLWKELLPKMQIVREEMKYTTLKLTYYGLKTEVA